MAFSQTEAFEYLRRAHEQNRLGHAYLICGPAGSGKRALAANLAQLVTRTNRAHVFSGSAPEIFLAEPESKSRRIVITQVRALEHALQMRAAPERRKVAIIADADRLQPQAANAFLKTLEEPAKDSLLLLLTALPDALKAEEARYRNATDGTWLDEREQYYKALTESMYIQRRAALVETLVKWWSDVLRASCGLTANHLPEMQKETTAIAKRFTATEILSRIRWLEELRDHLSRNIQEALAIEVAFLRIFTS